MHDVNIPVDDLAEFAIQHLLDTPQGAAPPARALPHALARHWPNRPALELVMAMTFAAHSIETSFAGAKDRLAAQECWQMAALLAVDIHMICEHLGQPRPMAADLLAYWQHHDSFFLI